MRWHVPRQLAFLALFAVASAAATIYRWVDSKGVTQYGEMPPAGVQAQEVAIPPALAPEVANDPARPWREQARELEKQRLQREASDEAERQAEFAKRRDAAIMLSRCERAQKDLYVLQIHAPAYTIDERGERVYIEDKDRPAAIAYARKRIAENCVPP